MDIRSGARTGVERDMERWTQSVLFGWISSVSLVVVATPRLGPRTPRPRPPRAESWPVGSGCASDRPLSAGSGLALFWAHRRYREDYDEPRELPPTLCRTPPPLVTEIAPPTVKNVKARCPAYRKSGTIPI